MTSRQNIAFGMSHVSPLIIRNLISHRIYARMCFLVQAILKQRCRKCFFLHFDCNHIVSESDASDARLGKFLNIIMFKSIWQKHSMSISIPAHCKSFLTHRERLKWDGSFVAQCNIKTSCQCKFVVCIISSSSSSLEE